MDFDATAARPLISRLRYKGKDEFLAFAEATLPDLKGLELKGPDADTRFKADAVHINNARVLRFSQTAYHISCRDGDFMRLLVPQRGDALMRLKGSDFHARGGRSAIVHWGAEREIVSDSGIDGYFLELPLLALERFRASLTGKHVKATSAAGSLDLENGPGAVLIAGLAQRFAEWDALDRWQGPHPKNGWCIESLLALILVSSLEDVREDLERIKPARRGYVERARELIEANATDRVALSEIADGLGVSVRSLQLGFMRSFGCTPMQYLITCRLNAARRQLLTPTDATTVTGVAIDCGFLNVGAFAGRYRALFGELPSETLKRAKGSL